MTSAESPAAIIATGSDGIEVETKGKSADKGKDKSKPAPPPGTQTSLLGRFDLKKMLPAGKAKAGNPA